MKFTSRILAPVSIIAIAVLCSIKCSNSTGDNKPPAPLLPVPSAQQLAWHEMEMNAFIHFSINSFTNKEWGYGDEKASLFNPTAFDASQWTRILKQTGFKGVILTCKHHDGFCLWPSKYTEHSVKNSPYKDGKGDIVKELRDACTRDGLKFGTYLSPWDRNHAGYGKKEYIDYYRNQLKELFTNYGPIFEMWFDGANGGDGYYGGASETRKINGATYYEWPATLKMVEQLEPAIIFFSDAGPGVRWVGNEKGIAGATNWNTISPDTLYAGKAGIESLLNTGAADGNAWIPAETDVSIRPGWFYHKSEDSLVKSPEELFKIYLTSVGRGSTLLLNVPPDQRGLLHENDINSLTGLREILDREFASNLALHAPAKSGSHRGNAKAFAASNLTDGDKSTYWATNDNIQVESFEISLANNPVVKYVLLQEYIQLGQRIKSFAVDAWIDNDWKEIDSATTIGYKRILALKPVTTSRIRIRIRGAKACPVISNVEIY
jgi:alpha-L-fucosidase